MVAIELIGASLWACFAWIEPEWLFFALLALAPLARTPSSATLPLSVITDFKTAAAILLGVAWSVRGALGRQELRFPGWIIAYVGAWTPLAILAFVHSDDPARSLAYLAFSVAGFSLFALCYHLERGAQRRTLRLILGVSVAITAIVLLQELIVEHHVLGFLERFIVEPRTLAYYAANLDPSAGGHYRPSGTMSHPNSMGAYFFVLIPFVVSLVQVEALGRWRRGACLALSAAMVAAVYATDSRGAAVCIGVALLFLGVHAGYRWILAGGAVLVLSLAALWSFPASHAALAEAITVKARTAAGLSGRQTIWHNALDLISRSPFLGVGPGNFSRAYVAHYGFFAPNDLTEMSGQIWAIHALGEDAVENFHAHNIYLQLAGEVGWLGPVLFMAGILAVIRHCESRGNMRPGRSLGRALALATAADAAALAVYGLIDSQLVFTLGSLNLVAGPLLALGLSA